MKKTKFIATIIALAVLATPFAHTPAASAVTASDWKAGRIIDDSIFTNANDMSVGDIQAFLNAKVPACDSNGQKSVGYYYNSSTGQPKFSWFSGGSWVTTTRAVFAQRYSSYYQTNISNLPFTCLRNYYEVPKTAPGPGLPASNAFGAPIPAGAISAAQMIYNAGVKYNINPKVLLVKLHTESAGPLTTDDWPFQNQYLYAMGAHCPDSGPGGSANCNSNYAGFSIQMEEAAALLRWYLNSMTQSWWQYKKPYQTNSILWNVEPTGCGAGNVYIETKATAALYTYTPYQPNAAALNNMYGTGDGCSAYGNRNFWRVYSDWFKDTLSPTYSWDVTSQYAYTDNTKTTPVGLDSLVPGQRVFVGLTIKNTGTATWINTGANPVNLGTTRPTARTSPFYDPSWLGYSRPARMTEASVAPGETATFEFWIKAPEAQQGSYSEYFTPVVEGKAWMPDIGLYFGATVQPARYTWNLVSQYAYVDDTKTQAVGLSGLEPGQRRYVGVVIRNTGNTVWKNAGANPMRLGITRPMDRWSSFMDDTWLGPSRPTTMKDESVAPGQTATFEFWLKVPANRPGVSLEYFSPLIESKLWLEDIGLNFSISVIKPSYSWAVTSQYAYTDASKTTPIGLDNLTPGQRVYIGFTARNTGNINWYNAGNNPVDTGTTNPIDRMSKYCTSGWLGCNRPARLKEAVIRPGQEGTFEFWAQAPPASGRYLEYFNLVAEHAAWMSETGMNFSVTVK